MSKIVKGRAFFTGATEQPNAGEFVSGRQLLNLHVDPMKSRAEADAVLPWVRGEAREFSGSVFDRTALAVPDAPDAETAVTVSHVHEERGYALQTRTIVNDPRLELLDAARFCGTHDPDEKNFNGYERHAQDSDIGARFIPEIADEGTLNVTVGGSVSGVIDFTGDVDTITVTLVAGQTYSFSLTGTGGTPVSDTFLSIFDPSATLLVEDDDGGNGTFSLITITAAASGVYTLTAESFSNPGDPGLGEWTLHVEQMGADEAPSAPPSAVVITTGTTYGFINPAGTDEDVYQITLTAGFIYNFQVAAGADYETDFLAVPLGEIDTIIRIYDSAGTLLFTNDDVAFPDDISSAIGFVPETSGIYYVEIDGYSGQSGGYVLDVTETDLSTLDPLDSIDWGTQLASSTVSVYFAAAGEVFDGVTSLGWNAYEIQQAMAAFGTYSQFANLTFSVAATAAGSTFQLVTTNSTQFLGYFNPPGETNAGVGVFARNGTGWDEGDTNGGLEIGGYGWITMIHEFGHGLGLAHPHDDGGTSEVMPGVTGPFGSYGLFDLNQGVYTTMSYNDGWQLHPDTDANGFPVPDTLDYGYQGTPMALDMALIQLKYGSVSANTGANVYTLGTANVAGTFYQCIWDTGGTDEIAYVGTADAVIDLTAATLDYSPTGGGALSWVDGIFGGYTIAFGVVIENATGDEGDDILIGNSAANILTGNDGNDTFIGREGDDEIHGDGGTDTLVLSGNQADYTVTAIAGGYTVEDNVSGDGDDGFDTVYDLEFLQFADGTVNLGDAPGNQAPTLSGLSASVAFNEQTVNGGPQLIDSDVVFEDSDGNFDGGTITVSGALAEDVIGIRNEGTGAGQVGVSGSNVTYGGVVIGTFAGGTGGTTLTVTLNNLATSLAVDAILENLTYANASNSPTADRTLTINVTDDEGASLAGSVYTPGPYVEQTGGSNPIGALPTLGDGPVLAGVDADNDGDLDLVMGDQPGVLRYFQNNAGAYTELTGAANPFNGFSVGNSYSMPVAMDFDGDGDMDVAVGGSPGTVFALRNNGNGTFTNLVGAGVNPFDGIDVGSFSDPASIDYDNDGDVDLVLGAGGGTGTIPANNGALLVWQNNAGVFTQQTGGANPFNGIDVGAFSSPTAGDVDGDGDVDLVVGNSAGAVQTYLNNGSGVFTLAVGAANPFNGVTIAGGYALPSLIDIDGDGDLDMSVRGYGAGPIRYFENTGSFAAGAAPTIQITVNAQNDAPAGTNGSASIVENTSYTFDASDFGFSDVLEGDDFAGVVITTLPTNGTLLLNGVAVSAGQFVTAADIAASLLVFEPDADENGANYASFTFQVRDDGGTVNGGVNTDPTANTFSFAVTPDNFAPVLTDVDSPVTFLENTVNATPQILDADVTLTDAEGFANGSVVVSGLLAEDVVGLNNEGTGAGQIGVSGANVSYGGVVIGTFAGGAGGDFTVTLNAAATTAAVEALLENLTYANTSDTPTASRTLSIQVYDHEGLGLPTGGVFEELTGANNPFAAAFSAGNGSIPTFVDVDADGDLDLVVGGQDGVLSTFANDGAGNYTELTGAANPFDGFDVGAAGTYSAPAAIDIDGDGDQDLVVGSNYGDLVVLENDGAGGWTDAGFVSGVSVYAFSTPTVVDLDGDGLEDLVLGSLTGFFYGFINNGDGSFTELTGANDPFLTIGVPYFSAPAFVDLDGDGDFDMVAGDYYGGLTAFTNDGGAFVEATENPFDGFTFSSIPAFTFTDLDGDGDLDGVAGSFDGDIRTFENVSANGAEIVVNVTAEAENTVTLYDAGDVLVGTFSTIQAAIDAASNGYRISAEAGTYTENLLIDVDVTIEGANVGVAGTGTRGAETIIDGQVVIAADGVTIDGVSLVGDGAGVLGTTGLVVNAGSDNFSLVNSVLSSNSAADFAIFVAAAVTGLDVGDNLIEGYSIGMYISGGATAGSVHDNLFQGDGGPLTGLGNGVNSETSHVLIQNNTFDGLYSGVLNLFPFGPNPVDIDSYVIGNTLTGNAAPRPVQIYPTADSTNIIGTDYNEAFNGDIAGLASGTALTFDGQGGDDHIYGFDAGDTLLGGEGNDRIYGQSGNDLLTGGNGNDLLYGEAGTDTANFAGSLTYASTVVGWVVSSAEGNDVLDGVEVAVDGGGQRNLLVGATAYATLQAALTEAQTGDNVRLASGTYTGTVNYNVGGLTVIAQPGAVQNLTYATIGAFGITILAQSGNDTITTGTGNDVIFAGGGNDVLNGGDGNDVLYGEGGSDTSSGGAGDDVYIVDSTADVTIENAFEGNDAVLTQVSYALTTGASVELLSTTVHAGTNAIDLTGNYLDQTIIGNYGANTITGGVGSDVMIGLYGDDTYVVNGANSSVIEDAGGGNDIVYTSVTFALGATSEVEVLSTNVHAGTDAIDLTGSNTAQTVVGNAGANVLDGKGGNDLLAGLGGEDTFAFTSALGAGNVDTLFDFSVADDTIALDDAIFTALGGTLDAGEFVIGTGAVDADDRIIYDSATGALFYDADGLGGNAAVQFATLTPGLALTVTDFSVI